VENCFKHGLKDNIEQVSIDITVKVKNGYLFFSIKNPVSANIASTGVSGIGLKNVKRRLDLLFKTNYDLNIVNDRQEYAVSLKMPV
jgi:sensor histidine kinase YesM